MVVRGVMLVRWMRQIVGMVLGRQRGAWVRLLLLLRRLLLLLMVVIMLEIVVVVAYSLDFKETTWTWILIQLTLIK